MNTEEQYRQEWAVKTGRPESDIYVPEAIREPSRPSLQGLRAQVTGEAPLKVGDTVRILVDRLAMSDTRAGDILEVTGAPRGGVFETDTPRLVNVPSFWQFELSDEGSGWERV